MDNTKINKRPSRNDTEDDILKLQEEFLREKSKNKDFQPAAKMVKLKHQNEGLEFFI